MTAIFNNPLAGGMPVAPAHAAETGRGCAAGKDGDVMTDRHEARARDVAHELHLRLDATAPLGADHYAVIATALRQTAEEARREALEWHSPTETPESQGSARRALVWLEMIDNPPEMNAPGELSFGHRILPPEPNPHWPEGGWFFDGQQPDYRLATKEG